MGADSLNNQMMEKSVRTGHVSRPAMRSFFDMLKSQRVGFLLYGSLLAPLNNFKKKKGNRSLSCNFDFFLAILTFFSELCDINT